jgi:hypothetical protein
MNELVRTPCVSNRHVFHKDKALSSPLPWFQAHLKCPRPT